MKIKFGIIKLDYKYFFKNGIWLYQSYVISLITGFILTFLYGNYLSKETFGQFTYVLSFLSVMSFFSLPGMSQALTYSITKGAEYNFVIATKHTVYLSLFGSAFLLLLSVYFFNTNISLFYAFLILSFLFPLISISTYYQTFLIAEKKFKFLSIINTIGSVLVAFFTALAIFLNLSLPILVSLSLIPTLAINLYFTFYKLANNNYQKSDLSYIRLGWHLSITQSIQFFTKHIDKVIIGSLLSFEALSIYAFALIIPEQINNLVKQFTPLLLPKIAELSNKDLKKSLINKFYMAEIILLLLILIYILIAPILFNVFFPLYKDGVFLTQLFSLSLLSLPGNLFILVFQKFKLNRFFYYQEILYFILLICLLILSVPHLGLLGAIISIILSKFIYTLFSLLLFIRFTKYNMD